MKWLHGIWYRKYSWLSCYYLELPSTALKMKFCLWAGFHSAWWTLRFSVAESPGTYCWRRMKPAGLWIPHPPHQLSLELIHVSPIERLNNPSMHTLRENFPLCRFFPVPVRIKHMPPSYSPSPPTGLYRVPNRNTCECFLVFLFFIFLYLAVPGLSCDMWVFSCALWDSSLLTRDQTQVPCTGSLVS